MGITATPTSSIEATETALPNVDHSVSYILDTELIQQNSFEESHSATSNVVISDTRDTSDTSLTTNISSLDSPCPEWDYSLPDSEILAQYVNVAKAVAPYIPDHELSTTPPPSGWRRPSAANFSPGIPMKTSRFQSPLHWISDWSIELGDKDPQIAMIEKRVFSLPSHADIDKLFKLYFSHVHPVFPVLHEHEYYLIRNPERTSSSSLPPAPISLALLYSILFAACSYLAVDGTSASANTTIRGGRCEFYSRAVLLYELGCEEDVLRKTQICLLLSLYRSYPDYFYENERWVINAYHILQVHGVQPFGQSSVGFARNWHWRRVACCWMTRLTSLIVGLKWTSNLDLINALSWSWPSISIDDFHEEYSFSWYLSSEAKRHSLRLFVAGIGLQVQMGAIGARVLNRTASDMQAMGHAKDMPKAAHTASLEEIELGLITWRRDNVALLDSRTPSSMTKFEEQLYKCQQLYWKLGYDYILGTLYQTTLVLERTTITTWAARIIDSSRLALWESTCRIIEAFKTAIKENVVYLLPAPSFVMALAPLTIFHLHLKNTTHYDPAAIENLATCARVLEQIKARYKVADFVCELLDHSLMLADSYPRTIWDSGQDGKRPTLVSCSETLLPDLEVHSAVIRLQNISLALGRIPPLDMIILKSQQTPP